MKHCLLEIVNRIEDNLMAGISQKERIEKHHYLALTLRPGIDECMYQGCHSLVYRAGKCRDCWEDYGS